MRGGLAVVAAALAAWGTPAAVRASVVPISTSAGGSAGHLPGLPGGDSFGAALSAPATSTPGFDTDFDPNTITFPSGSATGNTMAKVGFGHVESDGAARVIFARGTGISQTDPGRAQDASTLEFQFGATWRVPGGEDLFGPPLTTSFSIPIGLKIGAGGSATFFCDVHWDAVLGTAPFSDARAPYTVTQTFGPGTAMTSFTAPASPFFVPTLSPGDTFTLRGTVRFTVNNDDAPSLIEIPTPEDFPEFPSDSAIFTMEAGQGIGNVPEPTAVGLLSAVAVGALAARRRRRSAV